MEEIVEFRANTYSCLADNSDEDITAKGIKRKLKF